METTEEEEDPKAALKKGTTVNDEQVLFSCNICYDVSDAGGSWPCDGAHGIADASWARPAAYPYNSTHLAHILTSLCLHFCSWLRSQL